MTVTCQSSHNNTFLLRFFKITSIISVLASNHWTIRSAQLDSSLPIHHPCSFLNAFLIMPPSYIKSFISFQCFRINSLYKALCILFLSYFVTFCPPLILSVQNRRNFSPSIFHPHAEHISASTGLCKHSSSKIATFWKPHSSFTKLSSHFSS